MTENDVVLIQERVNPSSQVGLVDMSQETLPSPLSPPEALLAAEKKKGQDNNKGLRQALKKGEMLCTSL